MLRALLSYVNTYLLTYLLTYLQQFKSGSFKLQTNSNVTAKRHCYSAAIGEQVSKGEAVAALSVANLISTSEREIHISCLLFSASAAQSRLVSDVIACYTQTDGQHGPVLISALEVFLKMICAI